MPWYAFALSPLRLCSVGAESFSALEQPRVFYVVFTLPVSLPCTCDWRAGGGSTTSQIYCPCEGDWEGARVHLPCRRCSTYAGKVCLVSDLACRLLVLSVSSLTILLRSWSLRSAASYLHQLLFACRMSLALLPLAAYCSSPSTCCLRL